MHVIVIGAGLVGLAAGWRLAQLGERVTLVDPDPAGGATHAAAGMLAPVAETSYDERALGQLCLASNDRYAGFVGQLAAALGRSAQDVGYRQTRTLIVGADAADRGALSDLHELSVGLGLDSRRLTSREARRLEPLLGPGLSAAFLAEGDHQVDPRRLAAALLEALPAAGAQLVRGEVRAVTSTEYDGGASDGGASDGGASDGGASDGGASDCAAHAPTAPDDTRTGRDGTSRGAPRGGSRVVGGGAVTGVVLTDGRRITGDAVVVANAVAAGELDGIGLDLRASLRPVYGDVVRLDAPPSLRGLISGTIRGLVAGRPVYLVPRGDGSVVLGATAREDGQPRVSAGGVHELLRDAIRLVPAVAEFALTESVARARPGTPDNAPLLGRLPIGGLVAATGTYRNGVLLAPAVADAVAHLLGHPVAAPTDLAAFAPGRFAAAPPAPRPGAVPVPAGRA